MEKRALADIKKQNCADVYQYIHNNRDCPKQTIAGTINMSLRTVSQHLEDLLDAGFIEKHGCLKLQIGRKAAAYATRSQAQVAVGVEISKDRALIVAMDLRGRQIAHVDLQKAHWDAPETKTHAAKPQRAF